MTKIGVGIVRIAVGFIFLVHGWNKFAVGFDQVSGTFAEMGIPWPVPAAAAVALTELVAGGALFLGLWTRAAAALLMVVMAGAVYFAHGANGFFVAEGGFEYVLVLLSALALFELAGPGVPALDQIMKKGASIQESAQVEQETDDNTGTA